MIAAPLPTPAAPPAWRWGRSLGLLWLVAALLLVGAALVALSFVDSRVALRFAPTASAAAGGGSVTQALLREWPIRLRTAAAVLAALAGLVAIQRRPLSRLLSVGLAGTPMLLGRAWEAAARPDGFALVGLCAIAVVARVLFLGQPIRYDEALTYNEFASRSLAYAASYYPEPNNQVLYTLLVQVSSKLLGPEPWALRAPALVAGVLLIPATYLLGRTLFGRWTGLLAAAAVAGSSYLVEFSTLARGYTLQALLFVAAFGLVARGLRADRSSSLLLAALCAWLGFWTLPTTLYGAAAIAAWLLLARGGSRASVRAEAGAAATLCALLVFLAYLPVWLVSGPEALVGNRFVLPLGLQEVASDLPRSLARTWQLWTRDLPTPIALTVAVFAIVGSTRARDNGGGRVPLGMVIPGACLALAIAQRVVPFERVWLFLMPTFFLVAARGLVDAIEGAGRRLRADIGILSAGRVVTTASFLVAVLMTGAVLRSDSVLASGEVGAYPDAGPATRALASLLQPDDVVVSLVPASLPELQYEFRRAGLDPAVLVRPATGDRVYVLDVLRAHPSGRALPPTAAVDPGEWSSPSVVATFSVSELSRLTRSGR